MKKISLSLIALFLVYASQAANNPYQLIGKKGIIYFPEMNAEVEYISKSDLHWKTFNKSGKPIGEGNEVISYKKLTDNLYFVSWIEKNGFTVSQIINTKTGEVNAFWSFDDEKSPRGKRSSSFVNGKFTFIK